MRLSVYRVRTWEGNHKKHRSFYRYLIITGCSVSSCHFTEPFLWGLVDLHHRVERSFLAWLYLLDLLAYLFLRKKTSHSKSSFQISYFKPTRHRDICFTDQDTQFCKAYQGPQDARRRFEC